MLAATPSNLDGVEFLADPVSSHASANRLLEWTEAFKRPNPNQTSRVDWRAWQQEGIANLNSLSPIRFAPAKHPPNSPSHDRLDCPMNALVDPVPSRVTRTSCIFAIIERKSGSVKMSSASTRLTPISKVLKSVVAFGKATPSLQSLSLFVYLAPTHSARFQSTL